MVFNRLVVEAGRLVSRERLRPEAMDQERLDQASELLAELLNGDDLASVAVPGSPERRLMLGLRRWTEEEVSQIQSGLVERASEFQALRSELARNIGLSLEEAFAGLYSPERVEYDRKTAFHMLLGNKRDTYFLIPVETPENDPGLYGLVAGSRGAVNIDAPKAFLHATEAEREAFAEEGGTVVRQITALRPAFIAPAVSATGTVGIRRSFCRRHAARINASGRPRAERAAR